MSNEATAATTTLLDEKINDAREDVAKAQAKLDRLLIEQSNRAKIDSISIGQAVAFSYGRGDKRRTISGIVLAEGNDEKLGRQLAVQVGEGLDIQTYKIRAADVLFDTEDQADEG